MATVREEKNTIKIIANTSDIVFTVVRKLKDYWKEEHATKSQTDKINLLWLNNPSQFTMNQKDFEKEMTQRFHLINSMPELNMSIEIDSFRQLYFDQICTKERTHFLLESYSFPQNYIALTKKYQTKHGMISQMQASQNFCWVVHKDGQVKTVIEETVVLQNYSYLQEHAPCTIQRMLKKPVLIHDAVLRLSFHVVVFGLQQVLLYDLPIVHLVFSPIIDSKKSQDSCKIPFHKLCDFLELNTDVTDVAEKLVGIGENLIKQILEQLLPQVKSKKTKQMIQMLEFEFLLDDKLKLWLFKINPKAKFKHHKTIQDKIEEDFLNKVFEQIYPQVEQVKKLGYVMPSIAQLRIQEKIEEKQIWERVTGHIVSPKKRSPKDKALLGNFSQYIQQSTSKINIEQFKGNSIQKDNENLQVFNVGVKILNSPAITKKKAGLRKTSNEQGSSSPRNQVTSGNFLLPKPLERRKSLDKIDMVKNKDMKVIQEGDSEISSATLKPSRIGLVDLPESRKNSVEFSCSSSSSSSADSELKKTQKIKFNFDQIKENPIAKMFTRATQNLVEYRETPKNLQKKNPEKYENSGLIQASKKETSGLTNFDLPHKRKTGLRDVLANQIQKAQFLEVQKRQSSQMGAQNSQTGQAKYVGSQELLQAQPAQQLHKQLRKELAQYYSDKIGVIPAFYAYKKREVRMTNFLMKSLQSKEGEETGFKIKGDINEYFRENPDQLSTAEDQLEIFQEIDALFRRKQLDKGENTERKAQRQVNKILHEGIDKNKIENEFSNRPGVFDPTSNFCFEQKLANQMRLQKYDTEDFLLKESFFNRNQEEVEMIYHALKDPKSNKLFLDSLGLTDIDILYHKWLIQVKKYKGKHIKKEVESLLEGVQQDYEKSKDMFKVKSNREIYINQASSLGSDEESTRMQTSYPPQSQMQNRKQLKSRNSNLPKIQTQKPSTAAQNTLRKTVQVKTSAFDLQGLGGAVTQRDTASRNSDLKIGNNQNNEFINTGSSFFPAEGRRSKVQRNTSSQMTQRVQNFAKNLGQEYKKQGPFAKGQRGFRKDQKDKLLEMTSNGSGNQKLSVFKNNNSQQQQEDQNSSNLMRRRTISPNKIFSKFQNAVQKKFGIAKLKSIDKVDASTVLKPSSNSRSNSPLRRRITSKVEEVKQTLVDKLNALSKISLKAQELDNKDEPLVFGKLKVIWPLNS